MSKIRQSIVVVGLGYIGLPTASILATKGHQVLGVDISEEVVATINSGKIHIVEPDLDVLVRSAVNSGNLKAACAPEQADVFIIAVPTPFRQSVPGAEKTPDLSFIDAATKAIAPVLREGNLVILESTSPVGTTERIAAMVAELRPDLGTSRTGAHPALSVHFAHCPERVLPGHIIRELVDNDRIIGGVTRPAAELARDLYRSFCNGGIFLTDSKTAEMAKLVENSSRDVNIAFANELSIICDRLGINVWELIELANKHPRVNILQPGPGVGGHCIAVDPWFIVAAAPKEARLIRTAREVNDAKPHWVLERVRAKAERFRDPVIGCLGLAFKANIDDLRESPALEITRELIASGIGEVMACEPNVEHQAGEIPLYSLEEVLREADILLVLVDHDEFKEIDRELLKEKVVIDTRGVWR
ncbi:UDP-N-acetyl-D-mannosamine dehydrogenase [Geomesophilobacter sediminis]|uniref:UDP-N-acetyl-D-mannosamine dehydrogenase n=1 Tax=Geomesophilobacter sediminis TaxID=2798584 RepID=A0A8J7LY76_9BACT|nr:UDP-N-acetyl-D-mannosamine dehydrogenase [Geomesophilobacter sediminis]MBJ6724237.1 UDP-N-acetyl-D-mannosamine dehydrogenase [Geomesophilobacter sediminis]